MTIKAHSTNNHFSCTSKLVNEHGVGRHDLASHNYVTNSLFMTCFDELLVDLCGLGLAYSWLRKQVWDDWTDAIRELRKRYGFSCLPYSLFLSKQLWYGVYGVSGHGVQLSQRTLYLRQLFKTPLFPVRTYRWMDGCSTNDLARGTSQTSSAVRLRRATFSLEFTPPY